MSALPVRLDLFPVGALAPAVGKSEFGDVYDFIAQRLAAGTTGAGTASAAELQLARDSLQIPLVNHLDNPDGAVCQRTLAATADDVYAQDRWYVLTQTASATPSQLSNPEDGYRWGKRLTQSQVTAQRMGWGQVVPGFAASRLRGKTVTVGGRFKLSAAQTLRYALLAWTGTEDAPVSDVVNNWASGTYTTGNFFNSTTLTLIATGSTALSAATAATCSLSGAVPSNATNLIFVYWTEATAAQNVTLDDWGLRLVESTALAEAANRDYDAELRHCQRYYEQHGGVASAYPNVSGYQAAGVALSVPVPFAAQKRAVPTMGIAGTWAVSNCGQPSVAGASTLGYTLSAVATGSGTVIFYPNSTDDIITASCDL